MDEPKLLPCPVCRGEPERNGRTGKGGVRCFKEDHLVQFYGATQADADTIWNAMEQPTPEHSTSLVEAIVGEVMAYTSTNSRDATELAGLIVALLAKLNEDEK